MNLVMTVSADVLARSGAMPSALSANTTKTWFWHLVLRLLMSFNNILDDWMDDTI